jgi:uncharacterized membrane protein YoaT (DUF817 family)
MSGLVRFGLEFWFFGLKEAREARACLFAVLFLGAVFCLPRGGLCGLSRYDVLLLVALVIQGGMVWAGLESWDELKAISLFHVIGFGLELFKTSAAIHAWSYPDFAYTKLWGVPLFSGFMYAAVGSYVIQAWRLLAVLIYANFFTHHYVGDFRGYIAACALGLYARSTVIFRPLDRDRRMPMLLSFVLIGFFIWLAENISTFFGIWRYPDQIGAWAVVSVSKWSSWSLLIVMTFTVVAYLKHIKAHISVPT